MGTVFAVCELFKLGSWPWRTRRWFTTGISRSFSSCTLCLAWDSRDRNRFTQTEQDPRMLKYCITPFSEASSTFSLGSNITLAGEVGERPLYLYLLTSAKHRWSSKRPSTTIYMTGGMVSLYSFSYFPLSSKNSWLTQRSALINFCSECYFCGISWRRPDCVLCHWDEFGRLKNIQNGFWATERNNWQ